jgi:hypothetical protein
LLRQSTQNVLDAILRIRYLGFESQAILACLFDGFTCQREFVFEPSYCSV